MKELLMEHSWRRAVNDAATGLAIHNVKRLPKRGESGFTLVEVLVAIVVVSLLTGEPDQKIQDIYDEVKAM